MVCSSSSSQESSSQAGSALFLILIAVALFGALSYTVANMMRGNAGGDLSDEKAKLMATEIISYARSVRETVQMLKISNGCADEEISVNQPGSGKFRSSSYRVECSVFESDGGNLPYVPLVSGASAQEGTWFGDWWFRGMTFGGIGMAGNDDLVLEVRDVSNVLCRALNNIAGNNFGKSIPVDDVWGNGGGAYNGNLATNGDTGFVFIRGTEINGKMAFCHKDNAATVTDDNPNYFYYILIAR